MANFFGTTGADSITAAASVGFGGGVLGAGAPDFVFGNDGADTIIGSSADLTTSMYFGGFGDDSIIGNGGFNTRLSGDDGNDTLIANTGGLVLPQVLDGGNGNDLLIGNANGDLIDGGNDNDTINGGGGFDRLFGGQGADSILGGQGDDLIDGGAGANTLLGEDGQDTILGGGDNDRIEGGAGFDVINGGNGNNTISGGADADEITASFGNDLITGDDGDDTIQAGHGANTIAGGAGLDRIVAGSGADSIDGGDGGDHIDAGNGANTILGGAADDRIFAGFDNDSIIGGANDSTDGGDYIDAHRGNNTVLGGGGADNIIAGNGNDSIDGQDGNDRIDGGDGNNTLFGGADNDTIFAASGADTIQGGSGNDVVYADGGADTVEGNAGNDSLFGGDGGDRLNGGADNDRVLGEGGNDTILGSLGSDFLDGSGDTDTLDYSQLGPGISVVIGLQFGFNRVVKRDATGTIGTDTVQGFENFIGTAGDDKFLGWGQDDTFFSTAGNDTYDGNDGSDTVRFDVAGAGNVFVNLLAGFANDGLGGTDRFRKTSATNSTIENITTGGGADTIIGDGDNNVIRGGLGADSLDGGDGFDLLDYLGDSTVTGVLVNMGSAAVGGVAGGTARDSGNSVDTIANFENVRGTEAADTLIGSDGDNGLRGHRGNDLLDGGFGYDTADYRNDADGAGTLPGTGDGFGVIVNLSSGAVTIPGFGAETNVVVGAQRGRDGWGGTDTLVGIEAARGSNFNDILIGAERVLSFTAGGLRFTTNERSFLHGRYGDDTLRATSFDDGVVASYSDDISGIVARLDLGSTVVDGFGNTDTLVNIRNIQGSDFDDLIVASADGGWFRGRAGNDTITGGAGFDVVSYASAAAAVAVNLLLGTAEDGDGFTDSLTSIDFITGTRFADTIIGDDDGNWFFGNAGADSLVGGLGEDWVSYHSAYAGTAPVHAGVLVNLNTQQARDGDGSSASGSLDRFVSIEHAVGSHVADTLIGSAGANSLIGAEGDDSINGGAGNDVLEGGAGADTMNGGADVDTASYAGAQSGVTVSLALLTAQVGPGDGLGDILSGIENLTGSAFGDTLSGNAIANVISGGGGADSLVGGAGNDTLIGGAGADTMNGGTGSDAFRFLTPSEHATNATLRDRIADFTAGQDVIEVLGSAFGGLAPGVLAANRFALNAPTDADTVFIFNTTTKTLSYDADGNGAGLAVQLALMNVATLSNTDIVVV
jgi:Ca2+-binding RTX toxin-like protein